METREQWEDEFERRERETQAGLVACDAFCGAKENPVTIDEYRDSYRHWRFHSYLSGCSHAR